MSKKRIIDTRFWSDNWVVDSLNPHDRYLFLYLVLNERTTISGVYELPLRTMANETGIEKEEVSRMLKRLEPKIYYREGWIVIKNGIRHQNYRSPKIKSALQREMCNAPADLIELLNLPLDLNMDLSCPSDTTRYGMDTVAYTKPNLTKPNLTNKPNGYVNSGKPNAREHNRKILFSELVKELGFSEQVKPTDGRLRKLSVRLKTYSRGELVEAAVNLGKDQYMQGDNEAGKRYGTVDYFLRSDEIVDKWLLVNEKAEGRAGQEDMSKYV